MKDNYNLMDYLLILVVMIYGLISIFQNGTISCGLGQMKHSLDLFEGLILGWVFLGGVGKILVVIHDLLVCLGIVLCLSCS